MAFANVNGAVTHYADEGRRDARAIVFINALGLDYRIWDELAGPLASAYRIVRYDKRGHGLSELPPGPALIADYAADLIALFDLLAIDGAVVVGVSMGGLIAQELYRQRPDLVAALALCDTAAKIGTEESWRQRMDEVARGGIEAVVDATMRRWFTAAFHATRPSDLSGWRAMLTRCPKEGYLTACAAQAEADLRPYCASIKVPTLCLVGEEDGSTPPPLVRELAGQIGHARFKTIAGAGHLPNIERPEVVRGLIEALAKGAAA
jgi:3-oxoadipate enol-lactonase